MENKMTEQHAQATFPSLAANHQKAALTTKKKEVSWVRTILWMLFMVLLANGVMGLIAYFLFFYHK